MLPVATVYRWSYTIRLIEYCSGLTPIYRGKAKYVHNLLSGYTFRIINQWHLSSMMSAYHRTTVMHSFSSTWNRIQNNNDIEPRAFVNVYAIICRGELGERGYNLKFLFYYLSLAHTSIDLSNSYRPLYSGHNMGVYRICKSGVQNFKVWIFMGSNFLRPPPRKCRNMKCSWSDSRPT